MITFLIGIVILVVGGILYGKYQLLLLKSMMVWTMSQ